LVVNAVHGKRGLLVILSSRLARRMLQGVNEIQTVLQRLVDVVDLNSLALQVLVKPGNALLVDMRVIVSEIHEEHQQR